MSWGGGVYVEEKGSVSCVIPPCRLTVDQREVLEVVERGHNVFITGQAGTGKSFLVKEIFRSLSRKGTKCEVICSSGIAGTVYGDITATVPTVHSFYGLQTADLPWRDVVNRATASNLVRDKIRGVGCIIWDEASMSSRRILEIANYVHHDLAEECDVAKPFGGKQIVIVGEFLQLPPVPNVFDEGRPMYESPLWLYVVPHRYELITLKRLTITEESFIKFLQEIRLGTCSQDSCEYSKSLARYLSDPLITEATHVYFNKISALFHNSDVMRSMPGEFLRFEATDEGDTVGMQCPAEKTILLKPGCKVMLLWNVSDVLRNGTSGTFLHQAGEHLIVDFPTIGKIGLKRETWNKRLVSGRLVGSRKQYPVVAMYAITCHKSQGLTLPAVVVHCSKEFVPGLTYVACTRVKSSENIQVIGFKRSHLLPPSEEAINVCEGHLEPGIDKSCCRNHRLAQAEITVSEGEFTFVDNTEESDPSAVNMEVEEIVAAYFERGDPEDQVIDLQTVYSLLCEDDEGAILRIPPPDFDFKLLLMDIKIKEPLSDFARQQNEQIEKLMKYNDHLDLMGRILWSRAAQIVLEESLSNPDADITISRKQWTVDTRQLYLLITRSASFLRDMQLFFETATLSSTQTTIGVEAMIRVYKRVVQAAADTVTAKIASTPIRFNVKEMPAEGLAKVRYVGAWSVKKVVDNRRKHAKDNLLSLNPVTYKSAKDSYEMSLLLEEYVLENFSYLETSSKYPSTLAVTEEKQYRCRGLTHITDQAYEFFLDAEDQRISLLNEEKVENLKETTIENAAAAFNNNPTLLSKWLSCFPPDVINSKKVK